MPARMSSRRATEADEVVIGHATNGAVHTMTIEEAETVAAAAVAAMLSTTIVGHRQRIHSQRLQAIRLQQYYYQHQLHNRLSLSMMMMTTTSTTVSNINIRQTAANAIMSMLSRSSTERMFRSGNMSLNNKKNVGYRVHNSDQMNSTIIEHFPPYSYRKSICTHHMIIIIHKILVRTKPNSCITGIRIQMRTSNIK